MPTHKGKNGALYVTKVVQVEVKGKPTEFELITEVEAPLRRVRRADRKGGTPDPMCGNTDALFFDGKKPPAHLVLSRGHLIGLSLGGENTKYNIAPMYSHFNETTYRNVERKLEYTERYKFMKVVVDYCDGDGWLKLIPSKFTIFVKEAKEDSNGNDNDNAWSAFEVLPMSCPAAAPYGILEEPWVESIKANLPNPKPAEAPYAFLEALFPGHEKFMGFFSEEQKKYIYTANALYAAVAHPLNATFLMSDDPNDPEKTLNLFGTHRDRPQIDHVLARSKSGGNAFANAQLISAALNKIKSAAVEPEVMADLLLNARKSGRHRGKRYQPY